MADEAMELLRHAVRNQEFNNPATHRKAYDLVTGRGAYVAKPAPVRETPGMKTKAAKPKKAKPKQAAGTPKRGWRKHAAEWAAPALAGWTGFRPPDLAKIAEMAFLRQARNSLAEIAAITGTTKGQVAGKLNRYGGQFPGGVRNKDEAA